MAADVAKKAISGKDIKEGRAVAFVPNCPPMPMGNAIETRSDVDENFVDRLENRFKNFLYYKQAEA